MHMLQEPHMFEKGAVSPESPAEEEKKKKILVHRIISPLIYEQCF